jgi:hypothetical protein
MNFPNLKKHRYFPGFWLLFVILLLFIILFSPGRYIGIFVITLVALYVAAASYKQLSNTDNHPFRSRARDRIYKDQNNTD